MYVLGDLVPTQRTGAPYLARFSRDVGFHCSFPLTLDSSDALSGQHPWYPTSREKRARCGAPVPWCGNQRSHADTSALSLMRISATLATISAVPRSIRGVTSSPAKKYPRATATTGLT